MIKEIFVLEIEDDGQKLTYPIDSPSGLHSIGEALKKNSADTEDTELSPTIRALGEIVHNISNQISK